MSTVQIEASKLREITEFVGAAKPILEKEAARAAQLQDRAPAVVDGLIQGGILSGHLKDATVRAFVSDPIEILDRLEKTASLVKPASVGSGDSTQPAEGEKRSADQAFVDRLMG